MNWTKTEFDDWISRGAPITDSLENVTELNMASQHLSHLSPHIGKLIGLTMLDLGNNQLTVLPKDMEHLTQLEVLDVDNNLLTGLPPNISTDILSARNNKIAVLPAAMYVYDQLYLNGNRLTTLEPLNLADLDTLVILDLANNQLTALPSNMEELQSLEALYVSGNPGLKTLPPTLFSIKSLQVLDFAGDARNYTADELAQCGNKDGPISGEPLEAGTLLVRAKKYDSKGNQLPEYDCYNREALAHWFKANPKRINPITREPFGLEFFAENGGFNGTVGGKRKRGKRSKKRSKKRTKKRSKKRTKTKYKKITKKR